MSVESHIPWDKLTGDTLRRISKDFGLQTFGGRREEMIERLQQVEKDGLNAVIGASQLNSGEISNAKDFALDSLRTSEQDRAGPQPGSSSQGPAVRDSGAVRRRQVFEGVVLPPPVFSNRKEIFIGVVVPPISMLKVSTAGRKSSMKRKVDRDSEDDQDQDQVDGGRDTGTDRSKRRAARRKTDNND